jgi:uncharacterized protein with GYD domain
MPKLHAASSLHVRSLGRAGEEAAEPHRGGAAVVEKLGGQIEGAWYAFGDYDVVVITDMPDNISAAAFAIAAAAGGAIKGLKTTPLMTIEEGMSAAQKAGAAGYRPPS